MKTFNILSSSNWNIFFKSNGLIRNPFEVWQSICSIIVSVFSMIYLDCFHPITWSIFSENSNATLLLSCWDCVKYVSTTRHLRPILWSWWLWAVVLSLLRPWCPGLWCWDPKHWALVGINSSSSSQLWPTISTEHSLKLWCLITVLFYCERYQNCRNFIKNICSTLCPECLTLVVSD